MRRRCGKQRAPLRRNGRLRRRRPPTADKKADAEGEPENANLLCGDPEGAASF